MKIRNYFFLLLILFFEITNSYSTTYYLSNSGNDLNDGLSAVSSWKTIEKLNSLMGKIIPGDIILFERGSVFSGQINLSTSGNVNSPIVFGAYGLGRNPVISGSIPVTEWSVYKDKIFKANADTIVNNLFVNGQQMILARYPNSGFLVIKEPFSNAKVGFMDNELTQPPEYWNGSNVRVRTTNWSYEYSTIKNFNNGRITFSYETYDPTVSGWGYYLDNNFNELDTAREWYFEKGNNSNGIIYLYFSEDLDPNGLYIDGSIFDYGFYSQSNLTDIIIQDFEIKNQNTSGIYLIGNNSRVKIENCVFSGQFQSGISFLRQSIDCKINNCKFNNINGEALYLITCKNTIVSDCIFKSIGMIPGYGTTADGFNMSAIVILLSDSNHIVKNYIDSIGHDGINCVGSDNVIEKNVVLNSLLFLNDGGALKSYGEYSKHSVWRNNFIFNVHGNFEGTPQRENRSMGNGIYLDAYCDYMKVTNNTISNCGNSGIFLYEGCDKNSINGNVCYGNFIGIKFQEGTQSLVDNMTMNNIFFGLTPEQISVMFITRAEDFIPGRFDSNYYCNPFNNYLFQLQVRMDIEDYDFSNWRKLIGNSMDVYSKIIYGTQALNSKLLTNMSDDSLEISLDPNYLYKDLNLNDVYGSIILSPWSSKIILVNTDLSDIPELNILNGPLHFGNDSERNDVSSQWYGLIGNNLKNPVIIIAPEGFNISLEDDIDFTNTVSLYPVNGKINKIIFVKFIPNDEKVYYDLITNTSGELNSNVKVSGDSK